MYVDEQKIFLLFSFWSYIFNIRIGSRLHQTKLWSRKFPYNLFSWSNSQFPSRNWSTSLFYVTIPEIFKPNTSIYRNRLKLSIIISMIGLIGNEFITIYTPGRGVFDWNDVVWTIIGGIVFYFLHRRIQNLFKK